MDKVSIVIPIYKVPEEYLRRCIESSVNQTYKNIEILLIDDGSPDECGKICDLYAEKDNRVKVVHQKNKGLSGARNTGVKNAAGEWILFLDGDDYLEENCCEILIDNLEQNIDVLCFNSIRNELKKRYNINAKLEHKKKYVYEKKKLQLLTLDFNSHISTAWAKILNRKFLINNNLFHDEILKQGAEGIEFCIRLFEKAKRVKFIENHLYNYIYNENSISSVPSDRNNEFVIKCFEKISTEIPMKDKDYKIWFNTRIKYFIITTFLRNIFNPINKMDFNSRIKKAEQFLSIEIIKSAIEFSNIHMDKKRKILLHFIKMKKYNIIYFIAKLNNKRLKG